MNHARGSLRNKWIRLQRILIGQPLLLLDGECCFQLIVPKVHSFDSNIRLSPFRRLPLNFSFPLMNVPERIYSRSASASRLTSC